jgi:lysophospholipase L1-like esterase
MPDHRDDSQMSRFEREGLLRFRARQAVFAVLVTVALLVVFAGSSIRKQAEELKPGIGRDIVLALAKPAGWLSDQLPFAGVRHDLTGWLSPDADLSSAGGGFDSGPSQTTNARGPVPVTPDAFDPAALGEPVPKRPLHTLLVTGDSLSTPLDLEIGRSLADAGVNVVREPHLATGISKPDLVDWGKLSTEQVAKDKPDATVVFIGANEGFSMPGPGGKDVSCCGPDWAAIFANRVRQMMDTYRQGPAGWVYWLTVPTPRDTDRLPIEDAVNAAVKVAAQPYASQVRVIDTVPVFTPGDRYRDSMDVAGRDEIVRESDGIHLNQAGSSIAADLVLAALRRDFDF